MMMSDIVKTYLDDRGIDYQLSSHRRTATSRETAAAAHVKPNQVAKAVLMRRGWEYLMVVVPWRFWVLHWQVWAVGKEF